MRKTVKKRKNMHVFIQLSLKIIGITGASSGHKPNGGAVLLSFIKLKMIVKTTSFGNLRDGENFFLYQPPNCPFIFPMFF